MNSDHTWLRQQHSQFESELQRSMLFMQDHLERRSEVSGLWNDECAREMGRRFLNPLHEEAASSLEKLRRQHAAHASTATDLESATGAFHDASRASQCLHRQADEALATFRRLDSSLDHANRYVEGAISHLRDVEHALSEAARIAG
ncbi:hypothetical protein DES53_10474 [Roseimicrobium gellanilyticum]|uniref:Uncharacterized protein n=1 Tax=Roseimicrobium gellanilyticum TaxID=748857 RepID=A0A366HNV4_9BACT|nr:hypothetical protein [Roseimicrobium gellanilyticum]RBP44255.1 hypothetical protein DES53_10474 [Roseimicrobium gellanilyticum]